MDKVISGDCHLEIGDGLDQQFVSPSTHHSFDDAKFLLGCCKITMCSVIEKIRLRVYSECSVLINRVR